MPFVPRTHKARGAEGLTKSIMDSKMMIEHIVYEAMMDAIEKHPNIIDELTTSDYQGVMAAIAMNAASQILAL
jgi:hypothetical protein